MSLFSCSDAWFKKAIHKVYLLIRTDPPQRAIVAAVESHRETESNPLKHIKHSIRARRSLIKDVHDWTPQEQLYLSIRGARQRYRTVDVEENHGDGRKQPEPFRQGATESDRVAFSIACREIEREREKNETTPKEETAPLGSHMPTRVHEHTPLPYPY